jgi:ectoine hydroxylase-related dioxygenase (phytanoyl-CoA dioxygenase family)
MFAEGFMAYRLEEFINYFNESHVSLPLEIGDAVFFNPALFHAAGANKTTDFRRKANLLQISSPFGKPMESIDSIPLVEKCWDILVQKFKDEGLDEEVMSFVRAVGDGYPFPTNLDRRPPALGGMAPESEQDLLFRGIWEGWMTYEVCGELRKLREDGKA